ncbi:MAG TPA: DUF3383 family protein [Candidatus Stercorousia faecigallinarum]|nr:DUF3383 family protein [Candidatus Stercorousia faecigallinarum]
MANQIPISYVVNVSIAEQPAGLAPKQLSTLLILTDDEPVSPLSGDYIIARAARTVEQNFGTGKDSTKMAQIIFSQNPNILANSGYVIVAPYTSTSETTAQAISRLSAQIYFEGILTTRDLDDEEAGEASAAVEATADQIFFLPSSDVNALQTANGLFYKLQSNTQTKCLLYTYGADEDTKKANAKLFAAAYASRGLSVNYSGSNTCITMNLKDLTGIEADTNITETILQQCADLGVDCFPSIAGLAKVISNAGNGLYFDQVANRIWLTSTIQTNVFNTLATTRTKIPQTEQGMNLLKSAVYDTFDQAVTNGMIAPGQWNSSDTFGNLEDFHRNILETGYYIYSTPVVEQAQAEREQRKAPLIQCAGKEAGAIHNSDIMIYLEA